MSQEFLDRLLSTTENHVQGSDKGANCMICLEDFNTLNTFTGVVEWEIALPCGHTIGSSCIVTWLRANNNCPACRARFFPAQPRPFLEHGNLNAGRASTATQTRMNLEHAILRTRIATLEDQIRRPVREETTNLVWDWKLALLLVLVVGIGIYEFGVKLNEWSHPPPSAGPAHRTLVCMDWQDCSFLYARSS